MPGRPSIAHLPGAAQSQVQCVVVRRESTAACSGTATETSKSAPPANTSPAITDQQVSDAFIYLLSRLLVLRQEQVDFQDGFKWNTLIHRKPGDVQWPNPISTSPIPRPGSRSTRKSCLMVSVPEITGGYYTVQFLNGWGETVANINERIFHSIRMATSPCA